MATIDLRPDTITIDAAGQLDTDTAYEIDIEWINSGRPDDGLRMVQYYVGGKGYSEALCLPGNDNAPCYERRTHNPDTGVFNVAYYHVAGPTLADWQRQQDEAEFMSQWQEARQEARELYEFASGR